MSSEVLVGTIGKTLQASMGSLYQDGYNLTKPNSSIVTNPDIMTAKLHRLWVKVANTNDDGLFSSLCCDVTVNDTGIEFIDELGQYTPASAFATVYGRMVESAVQHPNDMTVYTNGVIHMSHPAGFYGIYTPRTKESTENHFLIVPGTAFSMSQLIAKPETFVYIYNPNITDEEKLNVFLKRKVGKDSVTHFEQHYADAYNAADMLFFLLDLIDPRPGVVSPVQTPLF